MQSVLLELYPAKIMDVGRVAFHLLQLELDLRLRDDLLFIYANNPGLLPKLSSAAAPARPNTEAHVINRQRRCRDHTKHAHERLHAVDFAPDVLAKNGTLEIRKNGVGFHRQSITSSRARAVSITQCRARSTHERSSSVVQYSPRDDAGSPSSENRNLWLPPSWASTEKKKIRGQLDATCLQLARQRWSTLTVKCPEKWRKEFVPRQSRPLAAVSFPPCASCAAV